MTSITMMQDMTAFCNAPIATFSLWRLRTKLLFTGVSFFAVWSVKRNITEYLLRRQGYRKADVNSQAWQLLLELGGSPTVCGFEVCADSLTVEHYKQLIKQLMAQFINFRSTLHKINGLWYFKEEFDAENVNLDDYVSCVPMKLDHGLSNEMIEEAILQQTVQYLNDKREFNVRWGTYKRAHIDAIYFHFAAQQKCVLFLRFNHSYADGILMSSLLALLHHRLFNPAFRNKSIDFSDPASALPLIQTVFAQNGPQKHYSLWQRTTASLYRWAHLPVGLATLLSDVLIRSDDRHCSIRGQFKAQNKLCIGRPIALKPFKSVARQHNGTVNDLFQTICVGAINRYATKHDCPVITDTSFDGVFGNMMLVNQRSLSPSAFAKNLQTYCRHGTNSNMLDCAPFDVNVKRVSMKETQRSISQIKFGSKSNILAFVTELVKDIPRGMELLLKLYLNKFSWVISNVKAPDALLPIPGRTPQQNDAVQWLFGMAVPGLTPFSFTLMTYNQHVRVGVLSDVGSVQNPEVLMQCFMDEWNYQQMHSVPISGV